MIIVLTRLHITFVVGRGRIQFEAFYLKHLKHIQFVAQYAEISTSMSVVCILPVRYQQAAATQLESSYQSSRHCQTLNSIRVIRFGVQLLACINLKYHVKAWLSSAIEHKELYDHLEGRN